MKIYKIIFIFLVLIILLYGTIRLFQPDLLGLKTDNIEQNSLTDEDLTYEGITPVPSQIDLDLSIKNIPKNISNLKIPPNLPSVPQSRLPVPPPPPKYEMPKMPPTPELDIKLPNVDFKNIRLPTTVAPPTLPRVTFTPLPTLPPLKPQTINIP